MLIFLIARTPAREQQFRWAGEIMKIQYHLYRLKSRKLDISTLESAKAYTIGVMRDDVRQHYLRPKGSSGWWSRRSPGQLPQAAARPGGSGALDDGDAGLLCQQAPFDCAGLERVLTLDETSAGL